MIFLIAEFTERSKWENLEYVCTSKCSTPQRQGLNIHFIGDLVRVKMGLWHGFPESADPLSMTAVEGACVSNGL